MLDHSTSPQQRGRTGAAIMDGKEVEAGMSWSRKDWWMLLGLTLVAALLRFYQLGTLPPGFQFDEAFNAIDAEQVLAGNRPLFLPANAGREVLYTYWQAFLANIFGLNVYTLRLGSAILGTLTVPATYLLLRRLLQRHSRAIAAGTALALAISLWHFHFSRYGIRVISMPLVFSGAFGLAWLGAHATLARTRILSYVGSGILTGLSVWTHPTGRFAPFVLLAFTLWLLWQHPEWRRWRWDRPLGGLAVTGALAFVVFLPLGLEFYRYPELFFGHASEVSVFADRVSGNTPLQALITNIGQVLGMFSFTGDREWTHGLAGRPVFDWALALVFYGGLLITARRMSRRDPDRDALVLLVIWASIMLFPSILSEAAPNYSRTLPALPALFVPVGLGLAWLVNWQQPVRWIGPVAATVIVLYSGGQAIYDYFVRFAQSPDVYYMYDADKLAALNYLNQFTDDHEVYISQLWGDLHATVWFLRGEMGIKSIDSSYVIALPPPGKGAVYAFPSEQTARAEQVAALWPGVETQTIYDPFGNVLLTVVQVDAETAATWPANYTPTVERTAAFVDAPTLLGMQAAHPDKQVSLFWRADARISDSLTTFVHLIDRDGRRVAQIDKLPGNGSYSTRDWAPGERVIDRAYPELLDRCAGGETLRVQVGWYELREGMPQRPRADSAGSTALAGEMVLPYFAFPRAEFAPATITNTQIWPTLSLFGYSLHEESLQAGSPLTVDLFWHSTHAPDVDMSEVLGDLEIKLSLVNNNALSIVWQGPLAPGIEWDGGLAFCRRLRTSLPVQLAPGEYAVVIDVPNDTNYQRVSLGNVQVGESTRRFDLPTLTSSVGVTLTDGTSDEIGLIGLSALEQIAPDAGGQPGLAVELVWQAQSRIAGNYKAFVHLLDANGTIVAQSDALPAEGYATNRWLPGEVVLDRHTLRLPSDLPPGEYRLVAGLYEPISMYRLNARNANQNALPDNLAPLGELTWPLTP